ncbi:MAG TPA: sugar phosphate isomerase/epimerase [Pirellulales bacterium]|jgi:sugar phosphate isomerase/epimerase
MTRSYETTGRDSGPQRGARRAAGDLSRRRFLGWAAAGAGAAMFGRVARARAADDYAGFVMGLQTYSLRNYSADKMLDLARDFGVKTLEFFPGHLPQTDSASQIEGVKQKLNARKLTALGYGVVPFTKDHEANRKMFEFAKKAGVRYLSADPHEDSFDSLDKLVAEYDIRIAIHNHGPGARYDKVADVLNAIKGHHPSIGACADLGHYIRAGEDPVRAISLLTGRLYGVHLKDFAEPKKDAAGVILGRGQLNLPATFRALRKAEFPIDACLALEYEEKPDDPLEDIRQCLAAAAEGAKESRG